MTSSSKCKYPVKNNCEVDEVLLGQKVSKKRDRGALKKKKISIVVEKAEKEGLVVRQMHLKKNPVRVRFN